MKHTNYVHNNCDCGCNTNSEPLVAATTSTEAGCSDNNCGCAGGSESTGGSESEGVDPENADGEKKKSTCSDSACGCGHDHASEEGMKRHEKIALVAAGIMLGCALVAEHLFGNEMFKIIFSILSIAVGLVIVFPKTVASLKSRSIDINVLLIVAIIGAIYVRAYEEAAAVLFLFSVGGYLESRALRKSNDAIKELAKLAPDTALVLRDGIVQEIATDQVAIGETITIKPGMSIPLDGIIVQGSSSFNDAAITGESTLVYKSAGDTVFAGSLALDGACHIETTSTVANSTLAKIASLVEEAQKQKSSREHFVQRFAKIYTPLVIVAAFAIAVIPPSLSAAGVLPLGDFSTWIYRACELLVISCPCAFVISTPVTFVSALARAAKLGTLVKGGAFFEEGARTAALAFDKTGTITEGKPAVVKVIPVADAKRLTEVACTLEAHSTHPIGQAIIAYAKQHGIAVLSDAPDITETAGKGIVGNIQGTRYAIGSQAFLEQDLEIGEAINALKAQTESEIGTCLFVAQLDPKPELLGAFVVADAIRSETSAVLESLRKKRKGIKTAMLTGDNPRIAAFVAAQVGIDEVHASLLPQDKAAHIQRLQKEVGATAFVGDGINDAPSLACANLGIAMGGAGSAAALSSADVVLMADDLSALPKFFALSEKTVRVLKQNIVAAIGLKALVALLVVLGAASMWMAVLADTGVSLLVILNSMRLLKTKL